MKNNLQKIEIIQEKMQKLKNEQNKIEQNITEEFVKVMKANVAFQLDFE